MRTKETATAFFDRYDVPQTDAQQFNVYRVEEFGRTSSHPHTRRDFYKIMLLTKADGVIVYADKTIAIRNNALVFGNPMIPYSWEGPAEEVKGYFCLFTDDFVNGRLKTESLSKSALFRASGYPVLYPDEKTVGLLLTLFGQMLEEIQTNYVNKYELLRSYIQVIIHESLKISPTGDFYKHGSSLARISSLFIELLERQFPISSTGHLLKLKNANEFAEQLSIHTNHLNKALRETTGKTTTEHITARIISEAKALLQHSDWPIGEVGYCLGFEHASNFINFFKKKTGQTPNHFRRELISIS